MTVTPRRVLNTVTINLPFHELSILDQFIILALAILEVYTLVLAYLTYSQISLYSLLPFIVYNILIALFVLNEKGYLNFKYKSKEAQK
jgi:hypothetical protein